ncbi:5' nucleotidase, NT5C type [Robiginitalea marina]|uniref:5'(3')-deoxyribonucleotidase n=1 Tax=Robiginitalea marina TaxID=2954105 RepID=A0ABT1B1R7_9FLAO|nr:5'(3')-deoxyribonucleotidase [Robiginitalea marina]MCO5725857.1 5'(3')-deoxyribonucleotidase [Robiginitalea marina]
MTVFVDMDEVLADTYGAHIQRYNERFGAVLTLEQCMGGEVWQQVPHHRDRIWQHYFEPGFFRNLEPIAHSKEVLEALAGKYQVYIASAAMQFPNSLIEKHQWLDEHFPFIHWRNRILLGDKHILRGDVLIDDRSHNLETFQGRSILFTSPHNIHTEGFERANDWLEVAGKLL